MRSLPIIPVCVLLSCGFLTLSARGGQVEVVADRVNLRACPSADCEVVAQVLRGHLLTRRPEGSTPAWIAVEPPANAVFWVYAELVNDDVVAVEDLRVRGGPGINYRPVGRMAKGDRLTVLGRDGDWLRVSPPPGSSLWISAELVKDLDGATVASAVAPAVAEPPPSRAPDGLAVTPEPIPPPVQPVGGVAPLAPSKPPPPVREPRIASTRKVATKPAAGVAGDKRVQYSGVVRPAGMAVWRQPSRYRLVAPDSLGRQVTWCYLVADERLLAKHEGHQIEITGVEYGVQGVRFPVVRVDSLKRVSRE